MSKFACSHDISLKITWSAKYPKPNINSLKKFLKESEQYTVKLDPENKEAIELATKLFSKEHIKFIDTVYGSPCLISISKREPHN